MSQPHTCSTYTRSCRYPAKARPRHTPSAPAFDGLPLRFHSGADTAFASLVRSLVEECSGRAPVTKAEDGEGGGLRQRRGARFHGASNHGRERRAPEQQPGFATEVANPHTGITVTAAHPATTSLPHHPGTASQNHHPTSISRNLTPTSPARAVCKEGAMIAVMNVPKMDEASALLPALCLLSRLFLHLPK